MGNTLEHYYILDEKCLLLALNLHVKYGKLEIEYERDTTDMRIYSLNEAKNPLINAPLVLLIKPFCILRKNTVYPGEWFYLLMMTSPATNWNRNLQINL